MTADWRHGFNCHGEMFFRYRVGRMFIHEEPDAGFVVVIYPGPTRSVRFFGSNA
jgi:hypothetical protein